MLVPLIVRSNPHGEGYEIIAGHRRKAACTWAGIEEVPVIIREMSDSDAVIAMIDSNLQREYIKPSEKAFEYKDQKTPVIEQTATFENDRQKVEVSVVK